MSGPSRYTGGQAWVQRASGSRSLPRLVVCAWRIMIKSRIALQRKAPDQQ
jgi:hypothetical protein